ncbi:integral membrane protein GPR155 isoform X2 [Protopterus annectens]|uniref:integral membrane protein GPR155 isoform X2 n=1 Tax=Protopterus annectens TaxID=7888 RepID=UPI001CFA9529|nr:integral membrane protein GPR155 isoform X2 [Protopterus annectens]
MDSHSPMSIDNLFPALIECFGIILCGYVAGRTNVITPIQAKGLGNFISKFALPALLFKNMVILDFANVHWSFLLGILIAKVCVFLIVCCLTLLLANSESRFSKAGLFPIFATQSNDFVLGYTIADALYRDTYPEYLQYIYLVAPVSLMLLNPVGFFFCEIQKWKQNRNPQQNKLIIVGLVLLRVLKNPIVAMVIIGIASNFVLHQKIPAFMEEFLDGLSNSFGGAALFYLGLSMVGKIKNLGKSTFVALILLITAKLLAMPLICREMVLLLDKNSSSVNRTSLSNYAFLYGVFPAAPSVAIYASQYNMEQEIVTSGMVISTFVSAPIMYLSAWLLTIPTMNPDSLTSALQNISFDISIVSLISLVWSIAVLFLSKQHRRLPHLFTSNLLIAEFVACTGMIGWNFIIKEKSLIGQILIFIVLYGSLYSSYLWTGLIALSLVMLKNRCETKISSGLFMVAGWGIPAFIVAILLIAGKLNSTDSVDSALFYGKDQVISTSVVLFISILMTSVSLMCMTRNAEGVNYHQLDSDSQSVTSDEPMRQDRQGNLTSTGSASPRSPSAVLKRDSCACQVENGSVFCSSEPVSSMTLIAGHTDIEDADKCVNRCQTQSCALVQEEQQLQNTDQQTGRHILLCLLLLVGLFANLSTCLWWLFNQEPGRLYVELQFFSAIFNFGQGFISFGIFGLDKHLIILPFKKKLKSLWKGRQTASPTDASVPEEIRMTCQQFVAYHKDQCVKDIVMERSCETGILSPLNTFPYLDIAS